MLKYWIKIMNAPESNYIKIVYNQLKQDAVNNNTYNGKKLGFPD